MAVDRDMAVGMAVDRDMAVGMGVVPVYPCRVRGR